MKHNKFSSKPRTPSERKPSLPPVISLENYDQYEDKYFLNSPRSLEACNREGINPRDLLKHRAEGLGEPIASSKVCEMRSKFLENKRKEMLATVRKAREEIIVKLDTMERVKPGTFVRPLGQLKTRETPTAPATSRGVDDQVMKFLEMQNQANNEQLGFFLRDHERHDANVKKTIGFAVDCLRRREMLDKMNEDEQIGLLIEKERQLQAKRERTNSVIKAELDRKREKERMLAESKNRQFEDMVDELRQKAMGKINEWQTNGAHTEKCESSRMKTITRKQQIYQMQESMRKQREEKMTRKLTAIEAKKRNSRQRMLSTVQAMKDRETRRLALLKQNRQEITKEVQKRNAGILGLSARGEMQRASTSGFRRAQSNYGGISPGSPNSKVRMVQGEAQRLNEERKRDFDQRMEAFNSRMKEKQRILDEKREQRQEQARQWSLTLKLNVSKKKKKEGYRKRLLEDKIKSLDDKQQIFKEHKSVMLAERFYAKLNDEMKNYYVKEALQQMARTKSWSLAKLGKIMYMFRPKLQEGVEKDKRAIMHNINKVLTDPFHPTKTRKNRSLSNFSNQMQQVDKEETQSQAE